MADAIENNINQTDIVKIKKDIPLSAEERGDTPLYLRCGKTPVIIRYTNTGKTLDEAVRQHLLEYKARL